MSLFSSLSYLLKRSTSVLNQTASSEPSINAKLEGLMLFNGISLIADSESSTINSASYGKYLHFIIYKGNFSNETETDNLFDPSNRENGQILLAYLHQSQKRPSGK